MSRLGHLADLVREQTKTTELSSTARPGGIYVVDDKAIRFPENDGREPHETRRVIVVQAETYCVANLPKTVLVVPTSSKHRGAVGEYDFEIPKAETGFTADRVVAYVSMMQPIRKAALRDRICDLTTDSVEAIEARMLRLLGFADALPEEAARKAEGVST